MTDSALIANLRARLAQVDARDEKGLGTVFYPAEVQQLLDYLDQVSALAGHRHSIPTFENPVNAPGQMVSFEEWFLPQPAEPTTDLLTSSRFPS